MRSSALSLSETLRARGICYRFPAILRRIINGELPQFAMGSPFRSRSFFHVSPYSRVASIRANHDRNRFILHSEKGERGTRPDSIKDEIKKKGMTSRAD